MKTGYKLTVFIRGPYGHGDWAEVDTVYMSREAAARSRRRILRVGIKNRWSGYGRVPVDTVNIRQVKVAG